MRYTLELQRMMTEGNFLIALRDNFEDLLAKSVLSIVERKIEGEPIELSIKNKIFGVVVECVQNICSSDQQHPSKKDSVLLIRRMDQGYLIQVGTLLSVEKEAHISKLFEDFSKMDESAIQDRRVDILRGKNKLTSEERDFLALSDIRTRSEGNMKYRLEQQEELNFLVLEITIYKTNNL
jgi:hypothetical protein